MCGIFGWQNKKRNCCDLKIFTSLANSSKRRGRDACGVFMDDNSSEFVMIDRSIDKLIKNKNIKGFLKNNVHTLIGHTRLATNGDPNNNSYNQPIIIDNLVLSHNGIIVNTEFLIKKYDIDESESDSVVFLRLISSIILNKKVDLIDAVKEVMLYVEGTINAVIYDTNSKKNILFTNNGSLYYAATDNGIVFASEEIFLVRIKKYFSKFKISKVEPKNIITILGGEIIKIDVLKKNTFQFEILKNNISDIKIKKYKIDFEKIKKIKRCTKCILPETTPFIEFDSNGICNFCNEYKKIEYKGEEKLEKIVKKFRSKINKPDCILAFSGGRDSSYGLHYLVKELGMHPIAVTFDWGMLSDLGRQNQARMLASLGVEHIVISADIARARKDIKINLLAWLKKPKLGMLPLLMQGDKTAEYYIDKIRKEKGIDLVFFCRGNSLEKEEFKSGYCGIKNADPNGVIHHYALIDKLRLLFYYLKNFVENRAYINRSLISSFLGYVVTFVIPHNYIYLWHYLEWDENKVVGTLKNKYNWQGEPENGLTWRVDDGSPAFYNYIYCLLQGFTENDSFRSHQIREGMITRDEAIKLIYKENKERFISIDWYFKTIGVKGNEVMKILNKIKKRY